MVSHKIIMLGASLDQNGGIATVEKLILEFIPSGIQVHHIASHDEGSICHRLSVFGRSWLALLWQLLNQKTDIVHIHMSDGGSLIRKSILSLTSFPFRKPVIIHAHGAEFHATYAKLPKWVKKLACIIFRRCNYFLVLSKTWKNYYEAALNLREDQVIVLPNPVELPSQVPQRMDRGVVRLAFIGRIGCRKGTFDLIKAFANLSLNIRRRAELLIAGDGEIEQAGKLAKKLNVDQSVKLLGWISSETRDHLFSEIDVFILPSYNEGLPMAILEAMGWGLPVIVTPVGGIPELIRSGENGLMVPPGDVGQLSDAIQRLIRNEALRRSLGSAARTSVMSYDIKKYCGSLSKIYHELS
ncbi:glycosyltransferase family 4 protein [Desulfosarcina alkanivorans]|uniref:glycosyltransferase family 4 protein n=1 Tax=Desulfosarcina alkanivorans TaxID=571177 RepID=UPI0012D3375B|nr:glycosyltransferase family 4 protein [Desulfosarcina alkanivorans]